MKKLLLLPLLITNAAFAQEQCDDKEANYQYCDSQVGWYIGGSLGKARTDVSHSRIEKYFDQQNLNSQVLSIDNSDTAGSVFLGYQFNSYIALEAGYLDLGEREVRFSGQTTDLTQYYDAAEHIYPQSATGALFSIVGSWPISQDFKLSAKLGYFDWSSDYATFDDQGKQGDDRISDNDLLLSAELNYRLSKQTQLFLGYQQVELTRDTNDMWSLGLRYYFDQKESSPKATPIAQPVAPTPVVQTKDSDKDGVLDNADNCPNSAMMYKVDGNGCTVKQEQVVDFALVINFANDSSKIPDSYNAKVTELANFIKRHQVKALTVYGHTSVTGPSDYNLKLSQRRADSVAQKLVDDFNIESSIITAIGKGESQPLDTMVNEQAHNKNRRIELSIKERLLLPVKR